MEQAYIGRMKVAYESLLFLLTPPASASRSRSVSHLCFGFLTGQTTAWRPAQCSGNTSYMGYNAYLLVSSRTTTAS